MVPEDEGRRVDYTEMADRIAGHDRATSDPLPNPPHDGADNLPGEGSEATPDADDDIVEPLPGLPHEDYGREFVALPRSRRWTSRA